MKRNMGTVDRLVRAFVAAPVLIVVGFVLGVGSLFGIVAFVVAGVMLATAALGLCPGYIPFGLSTRGGISTHGSVRLGGRSRVVAQH
jgi:Inner membrane protein YgaP-like, transmembrane domain